MSCCDVGMPLTATPGKKMKPKPGLYLPSSASIPIPSGPPVIVGGPYVPDLMALIMGLLMSYGMGALMKGVGKGLRKAGASIKKSLTDLNHNVLKKHKSTQGLSKKLCKMGFEPVDLITGRMIYEGEDFVIPGVIPLSWERNWYSDSDYEGLMGYGVHSNYDLALYLEEADQVIIMRLSDGRLAYFPYLIAEGDSYFEQEEKLTLTCIDNNTYTVKDHNKDLIYTYNRLSSELFKLGSQSNEDGFSIQFFYDAVGGIEQIIDTAGRRINFSLDAEKRIAEITATHEGQHRKLIKYAYNKEGDLTEITDALGQTTFMEFENHLMVKKTDRNGISFYWEYDGKKTGAKCIKTWGDGGVLAGTIDYGKGENLVTNSLGEESIYYFNSDNLCTQVTDAEGGHIFHEYTKKMEQYRDIDEEGNITGYTYDDRGNLTGIIQPDGTAFKYVYDDKDRLILSKTPGGASSVRVYEEGKLFASVNPDGATTSLIYNKDGLISSVIDDAGNETQLSYDKDHNLKQLILPNKGVSSWMYDEWGRCIQTNNPENYKQQFNYDVLDRISKVQQEDKNIIKLNYNAYDEVISTLDSKKRQIKFEYTPLGNLKMREEEGAKVLFKYNTEEQLLAIVNEHKEYYRFGRNKKGEIINGTGFDGLRRDFIRGPAGKVLKVNRPDDRFTEYEYDLNGKITRTEHSDGTWETFSYDGNGNLIEAVNQNSNVQLIRDEAGNVIKETQDEYIVESTFDGHGNRIQISSSLGVDIQLNRNKIGQVQQVSAMMESSSKESPDKQKTPWKAKMHHNSLGMEVERVLPGDISNSMEYDFAGRPIQHRVNRAKKELRHRSYKWNANDQLNKMVNDLTKGTVSYGHDAFGNLAWSQYEDKQFDYKLPDEVGNLYKDKGKKDRKYGSGGQLLEANGNTYKYDQEGNLITKITAKGNWAYEWYGGGMLKSVYRPDSKKITFEYDALGRRTVKIVGQHSELVSDYSDPKTTITRFVWNGNVPLHEWQYLLKNRPKFLVNKEGFLEKDKDEPINKITSWVFDEGTFKPAAKIVNGEHFSIITDYLGTPVEMYNSEGEKTWEVEYDIYGKVRKLVKGSLKDCPFRYQGQYEDEETGLYYNRFRYYTPDEGIYLSQDPIKLAGNNPNFYAYTKDNLSWIDPLGLDPYFRGAKGTNTPSFEPRPNEYKIDKKSGLVRPTHGVSLFDNKGSIGKKGFVPHEVDLATVSDKLQIKQRGNDKKHFEIMPKEAMSLADYKAELAKVKCK